MNFYAFVKGFRCRTPCKKLKLQKLPEKLKKHTAIGYNNLRKSYVKLFHNFEKLRTNITIESRLFVADSNDLG
jgi:hypothetical protein